VRSRTGIRIRHRSQRRRGPSNTAWPISLSDNSKALTFSLAPVDNERLAGLCGQHDAHLKQIEAHLGVQISNRGAVFSVNGARESASHAEEILQALYECTAENNDLTSETVYRYLQGVSAGTRNRRDQDISVRTPKRVVRGQNPRQRDYLRSMMTRDVVFGVGPAGTGKTYLAVACAAESLTADEVSRIVLVRPAVEAGERLGFLPGDIGQKVDPYLRPLYDALYELLGYDRVARLIDRNIIELAPLAYMRGRTLNNSFVILDEGQNTTIEQMKMFLTRIGFGSKAVITGDITQTDLPKGSVSGLKNAIHVLDDIEQIDVIRFTPRDVVRHPLVQRIVEAYDAFGDKKTPP